MAGEGSLFVFGVKGLGEITAGTDLAGLIAEHAALIEGDVVVVTQKIVSKAEGRIVAIDSDRTRRQNALSPSPRPSEFSGAAGSWS